MKRKRWMEIGMAVLLLCSVYWLSGQGARLASQTMEADKHVIVIDAGHGGPRMRMAGIQEREERRP